MNRCRRHLRSALAVLGLLVAVGTWSTPAGAHGGPASFELVSSDQVGTNTWKYVVSLTFDEDGHGVEEAPTVVAEVRATSVGPITMTPTDVEGRYLVDLTLPTDGDWTVRFTSVEPVATLSVNQVVSVADLPETSVDGASVTTTTSAAVATSTTSGSSTASGADETDTAEVSESQSNTPLLIAVGVVTVTALGGLVALRRRGATSDDPPPGDA